MKTGFFRKMGDIMLHYLVQFQINLFALAILLSLFLFIRTSKLRTFTNRLIRWIIFATGCSIILEPLTWIFDRMTFPGAFFLEYSTNFLLFLIGPVIAGLLLSYVDYRIINDAARIRQRLFYQQGSIVTLAILLYNLYNPIYFRVNPETNGFSSGPLKELHYVLLGFSYLVMLYFLIRHWKKISLKEVLIYALCFLTPILGMVVQLFDSKLHFSWTSIVIGLFMVYLFLETMPSDEDYLTKLFNRRSYETELTYLVNNKKPFGILIFDLNDFKEINDIHGHHKGDEVLIHFANALGYVYSKDGLASRLGGDEFAVILRGTQHQVETSINKVKSYIRRSEDPVLKSLTFSYGYEKFYMDMSVDSLYKQADQKMYLQKKALKKDKNPSDGVTQIL